MDGLTARFCISLRIWVTVVREHEDREDVRELIIGP